MAKPKPDEIDEELQKQDDDVYGTSYTDGDPDKFADTEEMVEEAIGNKPDPEQDGFEMEEEVEEDERAVREDKRESSTQDEIDLIESDIEKIERKEKYKEDSSDE